MKKILKSLVAAILLLSLSLSTIGCAGTEDVGTGACTYYGTRDVSGRDLKYVKMSVKDFGSIIILLDATTAPITVANFLELTNAGFYD